MNTYWIILADSYLYHDQISSAPWPNFISFLSLLEGNILQLQVSLNVSKLRLMCSESTLKRFKATYKLREELSQDSFKHSCTKEKITVLKHWGLKVTQVNVLPFIRGLSWHGIRWFLYQSVLISISFSDGCSLWYLVLLIRVHLALFCWIPQYGHRLWVGTLNNCILFYEKHKPCSFNPAHKGGKKMH